MPVDVDDIVKPEARPPTTIDGYIEGFPPPVRRKLQRLRRVIAEAVPDAKETIAYRMPTFVWNGNLVHFAAFAHHIGFYPTPSGVERFKDELTGYVTAKGSIQFPLDTPLPFGLIKKIVAFRVQETRERIAARKRRP